MQLCPVVSSDPNASNAIALTRLRTTINLGGVAKQMRRLIPFILRQKKANYIHICLSAPAVMEIIKQTSIYVCSGDIGFIVSSISRSTMRSVKTGQLLFAQL